MDHLTSRPRIVARLHVNRSAQRWRSPAGVHHPTMPVGCNACWVRSSSGPFGFRVSSARRRRVRQVGGPAFVIPAASRAAGLIVRYGPSSSQRLAAHQLRTSFLSTQHPIGRRRHSVVPTRKLSTAAGALGACCGHCPGKAGETQVLSDVGVARRLRDRNHEMPPAA